MMGWQLGGAMLPLCRMTKATQPQHTQPHQTQLSFSFNIVG